MNFLNQIDKCFYINLPHRTDKSAVLEKHLRSLRILQYFKRMDGVYPSSLGFQPASNGKFDHVEYSIAAARAHINVIKYAKEKNLKSIMVLEDDAKFHVDPDSNYNAVNTVYNAIEQVNKIPNWELLYLGGDLGEPELNLINENLLKVYNVSSSHAYVLSHRAFDRILEAEDRITHFDSFTCLLLSEKYMCYPMGIGQSLVNKTDIMETTYTPEIDFWKKAYNKPVNKLY